jgi:hypothetical protein
MLKPKAIICHLLVLIAGVLFFFLRKLTIALHGNFSQQDASDIVAAVRHDIWREAFPDFSWPSIKRPPRAIWAVTTAQVTEVSQTFKNRAPVKGNFRLETRIAGRGSVLVSEGCDSWSLRRDTGGWTIQSRSRARPSGVPRPVQPPFEKNVSFSTALSNESRLSFDSKP